MNVSPINISNNQQNFKAHFKNNASFRNLVEYAAKNEKLQELDTALNILHNANPGEIVILDGKLPNSAFSTFMLGKRSIPNVPASTPKEASYNGIIELAQGGKRFVSLFKDKLSAVSLNLEDIVKKYTNVK